MKYVFSTQHCKRYTFPTHINDLVIDRSEAETSEVFIVLLKPGQSTPLHTHEDTEQIFYVLEGEGRLVIGHDSKEEYSMNTGQIVRIPPLTPHAIKVTGQSELRYLAIDSFCANRVTGETTWDEHVNAMCREQGWDYTSVVGSLKEGE